MKEIYLDNGATTKLDPEVIGYMSKYFDLEYGNASSSHNKGMEARNAIEYSRKIIAKSIGASTDEIIFTSGGTESNNLALKGISFSNPKDSHIIVTKIEHDCVLNSAKWLETQGYTVTYLNVDNEGFVDLNELRSSIDKKTVLLSVIHGNNEIGTVQNLKSIGEICKENNVYFHTDACQSYTKEEINVNKQNLDLVTLNAHKIHGPKGVGALYVRKGIKLTPLSHGGGHEFNLRSGTENVPGIVGFAKSVKLMKSKHLGKMKQLRDKLINGILTEIPNVHLNGPKDNRLVSNTNFYFGNVEGESIGGYLNSKGIYSSTGSACSSHSLEPSHVLQAIGLSKKDANSSLRLTLGRFNEIEEIDYTLSVLPGIINKLRRFSPFKDV